MMFQRSNFKYNNAEISYFAFVKPPVNCLVFLNLEFQDQKASEEAFTLMLNHSIVTMR